MILSAEVLADGTVGDLEIVKISGYVLLDQSALNAVRFWKFNPARKTGRPMALCVEVSIRFSLSDGEGL